MRKLFIKVAGYERGNRDAYGHGADDLRAANTDGMHEHLSINGVMDNLTKERSWRIQPRKALLASVVLLCFSIVGVISLSSCKKDINANGVDNLGQKNDESEIVEPADVMILGDQLENAYSVANMQIAYNALLAEGRVPNDGVISVSGTVPTTHLYVKFAPTNKEDMDYLLDESGFEIFGYPLDYEIVQEGMSYSDPSGENYLWSVIPIEDFDASSIPVSYEILENCFIPYFEEAEEQGKSESYIEMLNLLEIKSLFLTGNIDSEEEIEDEAELNSPAPSQKATKRNPSGYLRVWNNSSNTLEGINGVKVRVHNILKWATAYTNSSGYYYINETYLTNVHYTMVFENSSGFKIWGNYAFLAPADYSMGWYGNGGHNRDIYTNSVAWKWATINNATVYYRNTLCPTFSITAPPSDMRIWTISMGGNWSASTPMAHHVSFTNAFFNNFLGVQGISSLLSWIDWIMPDMFYLSTTTLTRNVHSTMYHELAHASHYKKVGNYYWSEYISGIIGNGGYGSGSGSYKAGYIGIGEMWANYFEWRAKVYRGWETLAGDPDDDWYKPIIMKELQVNCGRSPYQIYNCLISSTTSHTALKNCLISNYGSSSCTTQSFANHGF
ncbi:MAG: hypothetical protein LBR36_07355 [Bacteroidales bacterium]|jgi:hypothetical protein|nr:hypothetical protein [Bacteroidales bacterium]